MSPAVVPAATYRLQFNKAFTFDDATGVVEYLDRLGISHCYASSYFKAVPGSTHGYDVADPTPLNPEIGDRDSYDRWVGTLRAHDMGHIVDLVPNHMGIAQSPNPWWQDVLENGPSSDYASFFDIDWHPLKQELENKVLLPILGDSYGAVLERAGDHSSNTDGAFSRALLRHRAADRAGHLRPDPRHDVEALLADIGASDAAASNSSAFSPQSSICRGRDAQIPELAPNAIAKKK